MRNQIQIIQMKLTHKYMKKLGQTSKASLVACIQHCHKFIPEMKVHMFHSQVDNLLFVIQNSLNLLEMVVGEDHQEVVEKNYYDKG